MVPTTRKFIELIEFIEFVESIKAGESWRFNRDSWRLVETKTRGDTGGDRFEVQMTKAKC